MIESEMDASRAVMSAGKKQEERRKFGRHSRGQIETWQVTSLLFGNCHHREAARKFNGSYTHSLRKILYIVYIFVIQYAPVNMSTIDSINLFLTLGRLNSFMRYSAAKIHTPSEACA
jgi:hypothetical protein